MAKEIPFFDVSRQIKTLRPQLEAAIFELLDRGQFILGDPVTKLEEGIAGLVGSRYAVAVASGTDGLLLSLLALGVAEGDAVITTPFTFFSTASTIARLKARPLFVDIDPKTFNIDSDRIEHLLEKECSRDVSGRTRHIRTGSPVKGIVPVHLFGRMAEMTPIKALAKKSKLFILEDAAQAIAAWDGDGKKRTMAGSVGDAGVFSFYPTKNLGAFGDAGMVVTGREDIARHLRILRVHGAEVRDRFDEVGHLSRMDAMQAAILCIKLPYVVEWNRRRSRIAKGYVERIKSRGWATELTLPQIRKGHIFHQFVVRVKRAEIRDKLRDYLRAQGIGCEAYYARPLHLQPALLYLGYKEGEFPEAERAGKETLALPIWPELTEPEQDRIVEAIGKFFNKKNHGL